MADGVFKRGRRAGSVTVTFDEPDVELLRHVLTEMLELLGPADDGDVDPLAAAVGIGTATTAPEDPALARLFPDGYRDDDAAAADFRRYTEGGLREGKRSAIVRALATLDSPGTKRVIGPEDADAWLRSLTDLRLVLGERLGVTEDWEERLEALDDDDPMLGAYWLYDRLTMLQESLVQALW